MNWAIFPSGNSAQADITARAWKAVGWNTAVLIDADQPDVKCDRMFREDSYRGTGAAFNRMISELGGDLFACVNDDMFPDPCDAKVSSNLMWAMFGGMHGVIQPIGRYFDGNAHAATSPIIGRGYIERFGPAWHEGFYHLYCDVLLRDLAIDRKLFHESNLLGVDHRHHTQGNRDTLPPEKRKRNNARHKADRELYESLKCSIPSKT